MNIERMSAGISGIGITKREMGCTYELEDIVED
jgi:hypothetical protein